MLNTVFNKSAVATTFLFIFDRYLVIIICICIFPLSLMYLYVSCRNFLSKYVIPPPPQKKTAYFLKNPFSNLVRIPTLSWLDPSTTPSGAVNVIGTTAKCLYFHVETSVLFIFEYFRPGLLSCTYLSPWVRAIYWLFLGRIPESLAFLVLTAQVDKTVKTIFFISINSRFLFDEVTRCSNFITYYIEILYRFDVATSM